MKKGLVMAGTVLVVLALAVVAFVRFSPNEPSRWHVPVEASSDKDHMNGAVRVLSGNRDTLTALDAAILALPRTRTLSGSIDDARITYVTRSLVFGFPDMTTIELTDGQVRLFARSRFGGSDWGVNRKRLEEVISSLQ